MTGTEDDRRDRQQEITAVVFKILGVAVAVGLVIGFGAWILVKGLGLDSTDTSGPAVAQVGPRTALPTTALPGGSALPTPDNSGVVTPGATVNGDLYLSATPVLVRPNERINLTGRWPGHDNETLVVQRLENGAWEDFASVQAHVNVGTFETYVMTSHTGDQKFRVLDPSTQAASNEVTVTVQ